MNHLRSLALALLAVFAPAKTVLVSAMVLVIVDLCTGVVASVRRGEKVTSRGLKRSLVKLFVYEVGIACAFLAEQYLTGPELPAMKVVAAMIGLTELKSIFENLDSVAGQSLFKALVDKLNASGGGKENKDG